MRDRLIELLRDSCGYRANCNGDADIDSCKKCGVGDDADFLIKNGVILPAVKVGQSVYQHDGVRVYESEVISILIDKDNTYYQTRDLDFTEDAIGRSVYLTREEAEKAKRGGDGNA